MISRIPRHKLFGCNHKVSDSLFRCNANVASGQLQITLNFQTYRKVLRLISAFRDRGHYAAQLDPLSKQEEAGDYVERSNSWLPRDASEHPDVVRLLRNYSTKGILDFDPFDLQNEIQPNAVFQLNGELKERGQENKWWSLEELVKSLVSTYCSTVGVEFSHIESDRQRMWLEEKAEERGARGWSLVEREEKLQVLKHLMRVDHTAKFLTKTFPSSKVFGIEGCEALIPGLWGILQTASSLGCEAIEMGMAHRGRMNVLHNFFGKPLHTICATFNESDLSELGDVKYHLGTRAELVVKDCSSNDPQERTVHVSLAANPSHLEAVNPVVIGKTKAKQFFIEDKEMKLVCPLLLHGDASFSGQGIVPETLELSNLPDYTVGGTVHVVINNQIGFTTDPRSSRTSYHCTNSAKGVGAPIFHVNADDVEAVVSVCKLAMEFRQKFGRDVVVDLVGYRRHGHNSQDDPSITQPLTYKLIQDHPTSLEIYCKKLIAEGLRTHAEITSASIALSQEYEMSLKSNYIPDPLEWLASNWQGAAIGSLLSTRPYNQTGVRESTIQAVGRALVAIPEHFEVHKDIHKLISNRKKMLETRQGITMAFAEALAFGTLMSKFNPTSTEFGLRGLSPSKRTLAAASSVAFNTMDVQLKEHPCVHIRLSGQDVIRGTFNQRHAAIYCQKSGQPYYQLNNLGLEQATISVSNSSLSESAVLGFEYGYSLSNEMALTIWEAQFGDFSNNAQCIIDNFVSSGEHKWNNHSSLVLLLPHGFDGQGPEHSSCRPERFLQLTDDDEDSIPGKSTFAKAEIQSGFDALSGINKDSGGAIEKVELGRILSRLNAGASAERIELTLAEIMAEQDSDGEQTPGEISSHISRDKWCRLMEAWYLHNSERKSNLIVVIPTTPANLFHVLRRQIHRPFSKPLVVISGKWLLHHKACVSPMSDLLEGTFFQRVIAEGGRGDNMKSSIALKDDKNIRRVIFCSGKLFYHLFRSREVAGIDDITIIRIEQIAPFPYDIIGPILQRFQHAELVYCQEEPKNQGAWSYVRPRLITCLRENGLPVVPIKYCGRKPSSSPASGGYTVHSAEQKEFVELALKIE